MEVSLIDPQPFVQKNMDDENPTTKADQNVVVVVQNPSNLPIKVLIMVCTGSVLLVSGIIFIILFYLYFRNRRHLRGGINNRRESSSSSSSPDGANSRGLEPSVLRTLSDFRYSSRSNFGGGGGGGGGMEPPAKECAVCLSEFKEGEMGRVLPNCKHSFHLQCIDVWFKFNSNCPLCRTHVAAVLPAVIIKNPDDHADVDVGLLSGLSSVLNHSPPVSPKEEEDEEEDTVITCSTSAYQDKKPPAELTSIICS